MKHVAHALPPKDRPGENATTEDLRNVFTDHLGSLYQLSFLLMGNSDDAERCFVGALEETVAAKTVPRHSICSRAKRAIVQHAVRAVQPRPTKRLDDLLPSCNISETDYLRTSAGRHAVTGRVLSLRLFERFVFILCVLERHSVHECARFLNCCVEDVINGRTRALVQIASSGAAVNS